MPKLNGYEVAGAIRKEPGLQHVVLAAVSGWGMQEDQATGLWPPVSIIT